MATAEVYNSDSESGSSFEGFTASDIEFSDDDSDSDDSFLWIYNGFTSEQLYIWYTTIYLALATLT